MQTDRVLSHCPAPECRTEAPFQVRLKHLEFVLAEITQFGASKPRKAVAIRVTSAGVRRASAAQERRYACKLLSREDDRCKHVGSYCDFDRIKAFPHHESVKQCVALAQ
jgi:hypothetical protein